MNNNTNTTVTINFTAPITVTVNSKEDYNNLVKLLNLLNNSTAPTDVPAVPVPVKKKAGRFQTEADRENYYTLRLYNLLSEYGIKIRWERGLEQGHVSGKLFTYFVNKLIKERNYQDRQRVYQTFKTLGEAEMKKEPRGLKKDIIFEVYHRMPRGYYESERVKEDMIKYLQEFPLTNDFKEKFHDYMDDKMGK